MDQRLGGISYAALQHTRPHGAFQATNPYVQCDVSHQDDVLATVLAENCASHYMIKKI
jgi:hypothetical protein